MSGRWLCGRVRQRIRYPVLAWGGGWCRLRDVAVPVWPLQILTGDPQEESRTFFIVGTGVLMLVLVSDDFADEVDVAPG